MNLFCQARSEMQKVQHRKLSNQLEFLIDNIFVEFGGHIFNKSPASLWEQTVPFSLAIFSYTVLQRGWVYTKLIKDNTIT